MSGVPLPDDGPERYTVRRVVFAHPFTLGDPPETYPAGSYEVETKEQALDLHGRTALVRTGTMLVVPTRTGSCSRAVDGNELDRALTQDAQQPSIPE